MLFLDLKKIVNLFFSQRILKRMLKLERFCLVIHIFYSKFYNTYI